MKKSLGFLPRRHTVRIKIKVKKLLKIVSEYDQELPQSQTADNPVAPSRKSRSTITIGVKTVCKGYQQLIEIALSRDKVTNK